MLPVAKAVTGRSQLITTGSSISAPGSSLRRRAIAALACSLPVLRRSLLLSGIEPSRAKGSQISAPSPLGSQRLQRITSTPSSWSGTARHH